MSNELNTTSVGDPILLPLHLTFHSFHSLTIECRDSATQLQGERVVEPAKGAGLTPLFTLPLWAEPTPGGKSPYSLKFTGVDIKISIRAKEGSAQRSWFT